MELNIHRVKDCTVARDFHDEGEQVIPGVRAPAFHVTLLSIVCTDGSTAKIRLFSPERLAITEGDDDGSTASMDA
jgi:hypothetical protein